MPTRLSPTARRGPAGSPSPATGTGNGTDTIGLYNPATSVFYLRNTNGTGYADVTFAYGPAGAGWIPIAGDWDWQRHGHHRPL